MKRTIISLLILVALLAQCLAFPASAGQTPSRLDCIRKAQLTKATPFDDAYVYPFATSINPAGIEGGTLTLQFRRSKVSPSPEDIFFVDIYECDIDQLFDMSYDPYLVESREYKMKQFSGSPASLDMTVRMDHRFKPGINYCYICGVTDPNGDSYDTIYFYSNLYVSDARTYAYSLSPMVAEDAYFGSDTIQAKPGKTAVVLTIPNPLTTTVRGSVTAESADPKIASVRVDAGYIYVTGVAYGKTEITVEYGHRKATWPVYIYGLEDLRVSPGKTDLCVGETDVPFVIGVPDHPVHLNWYSNHPEIARVENGVITAVSPGTAVVSGETIGHAVELQYTVSYHALPKDTPVTGPTATQPKQAVGHCSLCGKNDAVNIYEPAIFTDTKASAWYAKHVDKVYDLGLMNGVGEHTFAPNANVTRAMAATVLYRIAGKPKVEGAGTFTDVAPGKYYSKAVVWAQETGVVNGYPDNTFRPDENITREQLAAILCRYAAATGCDISAATDLGRFPDGGKVHNYAKKALARAVGEKLITGVGVDGTTFLQPTNNATRAQFATIISRYLTTIQPVSATDDPDSSSNPEE